MENIIAGFAAENNLIYGICNAEPLNITPELLKVGNVPFVKKDLALRTDPKASFDKAESIIVLGIGYNKELSFPEDELPRGILSVYTVGEDYHVKLRRLLLNLAEKLNLPENERKIFVDSGNLAERELAKKAGLGWLGKNCAVISEKFGGFFHIGYMLTSLPLKPTPGYKPDFSLCGDCRICIEACPGKALPHKGYACNTSACVSFITQNKTSPNQREMQSMGNMLYGCDVCVGVCPYKGEYVDKITDINLIKPTLASILNMTDSEFNLLYKNTPLAWRGLKILKRNAEIALQNINPK